MRFLIDEMAASAIAAHRLERLAVLVRGMDNRGEFMRIRIFIMADIALVIRNTNLN